MDQSKPIFFGSQHPVDAASLVPDAQAVQRRVNHIGETMSFAPHTGNASHQTPSNTYKNGDDRGMVYYCFTYVIFISTFFNSRREI